MRNFLERLRNLPWAEWKRRTSEGSRTVARQITSLADENRPDAEEYFRDFVLPVSGYVMAVIALGVPVYLMLFGAPLFGIVAFVTLCLLVWLPKLTYGVRRQYVQCGMSLLFVVTIGLGVPKANYIFQTQGCTYAASHKQFGHLTSLEDPRLTQAQRNWATRTADALSADWPADDLPPISPLIIANMILHSPLLIWELEWNPEGDHPEMGIYQAKSAYAGMIFDNRLVCALYDRIDRTQSTNFRSANLNRIKKTTDTALELILPKLAEMRDARTLRAATLRSQPSLPRAAHDGAYDQPPQTSPVSSAALVHAAP